MTSGERRAKLRAREGGRKITTNISKTFALVCHSSGALRHVKIPDGKLLVESKTVTGFTNG